jgi:UDP-3-O-[3-hydroxymyristoyl] glucosamine N-acyltransferase
MLTTQEISDLIGGKLEGNPNLEIYSINKIENAKKGSITFIANDKFRKYFKNSDASAIITDNSFDFFPNGHEYALIKVDNVYFALSKLLKHIEKDKIDSKGISELSYISQDVKVGVGTSICAFSYLSKGVIIGENTNIATHVFVGKGVKIGNNVKIYPGVKIYNDCIVGNNCIIHANTVIGSDGFGYKPNSKGEFERIPQVGKVILEDNVEIGANTVIDRATFGETIIHKGVKLDNLIQIAHNVEIGENTVIAAQTGIAGSVILGENIIVGGQVGFNNGIKIANGNQFQAQSGVLQNISTKNGRYQGSPVIEYYKHMRSSVVFKKLPEMQKQISKLEKQIEKLNKLITNEQKDD